MPTITEESAILSKTKELCASILEEPELKIHLSRMETFIGDEESRAQYVRLTEAGDALQQKEQLGEKLTLEEIKEFKDLQSVALENTVIRDFFDAQAKLQAVHSQISGYVSKTLELGRVPGPEDFADEGGCGEGCGCH